MNNYHEVAILQLQQEIKRLKENLDEFIEYVNEALDDLDDKYKKLGSGDIE